MKKTPSLLAASALFLFGCTAGNQDNHDHGHVHVAMHGGILVELGDHAHNLELVLDKETGTLSVYTFGGHAKKFIRVKQPSIVLSLDEPLGDVGSLELQAVANEVTGETVGDTAYFSIQNDNLKEVASLSGKVNSVELQGHTYTEVPFKLNGSHGHSH